MTTVDPAAALQTGLYIRLNGDGTLGALVSGVYDGPPEDAEFPYVVIGEMTSVVDGAHDADGRQTSVVVHTWTRAESFSPGNTIAARIVLLLAHGHAALDSYTDGHKVWRVDHEFAQALVDPEPGIRHRIDRFRIWTSQD